MTKEGKEGKGGINMKWENMSGKIKQLKIKKREEKVKEKEERKRDVGMKGRKRREGRRMKERGK